MAHRRFLTGHQVDKFNAFQKEGLISHAIFRRLENHRDCIKEYIVDKKSMGILWKLPETPILLTQVVELSFVKRQKGKNLHPNTYNSTFYQFLSVARSKYTLHIHI